ncbi:MAG: DUF1150 family protein [Alphaproteobacteria bacterium]
MINNKDLNSIAFFKGLSAQDFRNFGVQQLAYIRPVMIQNRPAFAIHAADGTPLSVMDTRDTAIIAVRHNDLEPVTVH